MTLFSKEKTIGIFKGFSAGSLEFHAELTLPYISEFQRAPMHGQFLVVQLEDDEEGVLGRITSISSLGRLTSSAGEDYGIRAITEERPIPEELRKQYLKYRANMRVLGVVRRVEGKLVYAASHRRLPHVGSKVSFLTGPLLKEVAGHNIEGAAEIGHLALGEFIYARGDERLKTEPWMQIKGPAIVPRFHVLSLVARRTLVFARAGFGKSNLVKLLFSNLYSTTPTVTKRGGQQVPVGTLIFDPDGEYFWPDDKSRPALCDVKELQDKVVVFTPKEAPSAFYRSFVAGNMRLDIRRLPPSNVISIALTSEKQEQQNVRKLKGMNPGDWQALVDLIYKDGYNADGDTVKRLLRLESGQDAEMLAARANMTSIVRMLHDPSSQLMDMLIAALRTGKLCVVDISQMRGTPALVLSGLILGHIFEYNQAEFTKAEPKTIPVIAVIEEAQTVLGSTGSSGESPYISWVKEGRKFDLGAVLITQQPGSIPKEILSQGDNWFAFHLLSAGDLRAVQSANAHFSDDILSSLLNEPLPGHGVFWSSVSGKSYPIPIRAMSFEGRHSPADPHNNRPAIETAASDLRKQYQHRLNNASQGTTGTDVREPGPTSQQPDTLASYQALAIRAFTADTRYLAQIANRGVPWRGFILQVQSYLPNDVHDSEPLAHTLVSTLMTQEFGAKGAHWDVERRPSKTRDGQHTTWVVLIRNRD